MTPEVQELLDVLSDRIYVMVTLKNQEISHSNIEHERINIEIQNISERMTKDEIMSKYKMFNWMHYPAHYKDLKKAINFWSGGGIIFCPYTPIMRPVHANKVFKLR